MLLDKIVKRGPQTKLKLEQKHKFVNYESCRTLAFAMELEQILQIDCLKLNFMRMESTGLPSAWRAVVCA
jgi:hypothetical protein